jgi:uncharacterized protein YecE (DUF72 family)
MGRLQTPPIVTTDFIYLRLIGDRSIHESNFGKLQRDRSLEMKVRAEKINQMSENEKSIKIGIVAANNHYGGFGPGTVNMFREMVDMDPISFENIDLKDIDNQLGLERNFRFGLDRSNKVKQTRMSDFI